jgi:ketosteroid isomerase-like protein
MSDEARATKSPEEVADTLFGAVERGEIDALREVFHPDARTWHNTDGLEQSVDQTLKVLRWLSRNSTVRRYDDVRRERTPRGFVQMHTLRIEKADGRTIRIPACVVAEVRDGRIRRIDEYLDSAQVAEVSR